MERAQPSRTTLIVAVLVALLFPALTYCAFGRAHLNLADEGYLWYGVQRTVAGEVPLRDFQAYDPGRYYWCAGLAPLFGDGILGVRAAVALYAALGLFAGLALAARVVRSPLALVGVGALLALWFFPRHKLFEPATALILAWSTVRVLEQPTTRRWLCGGALVGLAAFMGRNHALYGGLALGVALLLDAWKEPRPGFVRRAGAVVAGTLLGLTPFLGLVLFVPGFGASFVESVRVILKVGANLPVAWPWPWSVSWSAPSAWGSVRIAAQVAAFLLASFAAPTLFLVVLGTRREHWRARAPLVGAALVGGIYLHHAGVRSDVPHLAQCIPPLFLALLLAPLTLDAGRGVRVASLGGLALLSLAVSATWNPLFTNLGSGPLNEREIGGEHLQLLDSQARYLAGVQRAVAENVGDAPLFIAPNRPTLYCVLAKTAPTWWIYYFWQAPAEEQQATIERLRARGVAWALIIDDPVDDDEALLFRATNELVWQHLEREWTRVATPSMPKSHILLHRR